MSVLPCVLYTQTGGASSAFIFLGGAFEETEESEIEGQSSLSKSLRLGGVWAPKSPTEPRCSVDFAYMTLLFCSAIGFSFSGSGEAWRP